MAAENDTVSRKTFEEILDEKNTLMYSSVGTSMEPFIREGRDILCIDKKTNERLKKLDVAFFVRPNIEGRGKYVLHRILKVNSNGTYWIVGDNCTAGETVKEENILGILAAVVRKGNRISVNDFGYKVYVYLWCAPYHLRFFILNFYKAIRSLAGRIIRKLHIHPKT